MGRKIAAFTAAPMTLAPAAFGFLPSFDVPPTYLVPSRTPAAVEERPPTLLCELFQLPVADGGRARL